MLNCSCNYLHSHPLSLLLAAKRNLKGTKARPEKSPKKRPTDKALNKGPHLPTASLPKTAKTAGVSKPVYNVAGRTIFSKFDFMDPLDKAADSGPARRKGPKKQKSLAADLQAPKDPKQAIAQLERRQKKLQELQETAPEKAEAMRQKVRREGGGTS